MASASDKLAEYVANKGGKRVIRKVLVANNGMAAMDKGYFIHAKMAKDNQLGDENAIKFVAMATPEDIGANAEFIRYADDFVEVPGGKNVNNYANVDLITEIAVREVIPRLARLGARFREPEIADGFGEEWNPVHRSNCTSHVCPRR